VGRKVVKWEKSYGCNCLKWIISFTRVWKKNCSSQKCRFGVFFGKVFQNWLSRDPARSLSGTSRTKRDFECIRVHPILSNHFGTVLNYMLFYNRSFISFAFIVLTQPYSSYPYMLYIKINYENSKEWRQTHKIVGFKTAVCPLCDVATRNRMRLNELKTATNAWPSRRLCIKPICEFLVITTYASTPEQRSNYLFRSLYKQEHCLVT